VLGFLTLIVLDKFTQISGQLSPATLAAEIIDALLTANYANVNIGLTIV
jgi:hypothetical protein